MNRGGRQNRSGLLKTKQKKNKKPYGTDDPDGSERSNEIGFFSFNLFN